MEDPFLNFCITVLLSFSFFLLPAQCSCLLHSPLDFHLMTSCLGFFSHEAMFAHRCSVMYSIYWLENGNLTSVKWFWDILLCKMLCQIALWIVTCSRLPGPALQEAVSSLIVVMPHCNGSQNYSANLWQGLCAPGLCTPFLIWYFKNYKCR